MYGSGGSKIRYQVRLQCKSENLGDVCNNPVSCDIPPNTLRYSVFRSEGGGPFVKTGEVCLDSEDAEQLGVITPGLVAREFRRLDWPQSPTLVQPPGGETLVNLPTIFLTTNTEPTTRTVTLLGQRIEIEATPVRYRWRYGDGTTSTSTSPGHRYPDHDIAHTYRDGDTTVRASVDTVYAGRYRIAGGPWQDIPTTRTITGAPVSLLIRTATPQLVTGR